ncbi:MAG: LemA family protein [Chitinophagaceae bacterium]|nr:MAG: LemA family protein [Chitinophagaceae bacterium]
MKSKKPLLVAGIIVVVIAIYLGTSYNSLVSKEENLKKTWADVQATYQRRLDLVPSLVNIVKGVSDFESSTLEAIAAARSRAASGQAGASLDGENYKGQSVAQDSLAAAANRVILLVERYPVLKGTAAYSGLQTQLEGTERRIKVARTDFNKAVAEYNNAVRAFPGSIAAGIFGFKAQEGFAADKGAENPVEIKF